MTLSFCVSFRDLFVSRVLYLLIYLFLLFIFPILFFKEKNFLSLLAFFFNLKFSVLSLILSFYILSIILLLLLYIFLCVVNIMCMPKVRHLYKIVAYD